MSADAPLLVTLGLDDASFTRLEALRRELFPPERNLVPAHISLFHHLPAAERPHIERVLEAEARCAPFPLDFPALRSLGHALAAEVRSPELLALQLRLARAFHPWLTRQDRQRYRPHVTVMNKVPVEAFRAALALHQPAWAPWTGSPRSLLLWEYLGGPWRALRAFPLSPPGAP